MGKIKFAKGSIERMYVIGMIFMITGLGIALIFRLNDIGRIFIGIGAAMAVFVALFK